MGENLVRMTQIKTHFTGSSEIVKKCLDTRFGNKIYIFFWKRQLRKPCTHYCRV